MTPLILSTVQPPNRPPFAMVGAHAALVLLLAFQANAAPLVEVVVFTVPLLLDVAGRRYRGKVLKFTACTEAVIVAILLMSQPHAISDHAAARELLDSSEVAADPVEDALTISVSVFANGRLVTDEDVRLWVVGQSRPVTTRGGTARFTVPRNTSSVNLQVEDGGARLPFAVSLGSRVAPRPLSICLDLVTRTTTCIGETY